MDKEWCDQFMSQIRCAERKPVEILARNNTKKLEMLVMAMQDHDYYGECAACYGCYIRDSRRFPFFHASLYAA